MQSWSRQKVEKNHTNIQGGYNNDPVALTALHEFLRRMNIVPVLRDELDAVFAGLNRFAPRMDLADGRLVTLSMRY